MALKIDNQLRLFLLGVLGASLVAVLVTVIVVSTGGRSTPTPTLPRSDIARGLSSLDLSDFKIPPSYTEAWKQKWYPSRARQNKWTWEEVQRFWRDPRKSALKSIIEENNRKMNDLFKGVQ